jgi:potassium-transporting ATPase KdpC subunit
MIKELGPGFRLTLIFTVITGLLYPGLMTGVSKLIFPKQANGSLVTVDGKVVASSLIGQPFSKPEYFHPRPSAAGSGYDATASGGSNLGPTSAKLLRGTTKMDDKNNEVVDYDGISLRTVHYSVENGIPYESSVPLDRFRTAQGELDDVKLIKAFNDEKTPLIFRATVPIPPDAVTASSSGLDPHISPANADAQAVRVAKARNVSVDEVKQMVASYTENADFGFLGEPRVNVTMLNIGLDQRFGNSNNGNRDRK